MLKVNRILKAKARLLLAFFLFSCLITKNISKIQNNYNNSNIEDKNFVRLLNLNLSNLRVEEEYLNLKNIEIIQIKKTANEILQFIDEFFEELNSLFQFNVIRTSFSIMERKKMLCLYLCMINHYIVLTAIIENSKDHVNYREIKYNNLEKINKIIKLTYLIILEQNGKIKNIILENFINGYLSAITSENITSEEYETLYQVSEVLDSLNEPFKISSIGCLYKNLDLENLQDKELLSILYENGKEELVDISIIDNTIELCEKILNKIEDIEDIVSIRANEFFITNNRKSVKELINYISNFISDEQMKKYIEDNEINIEYKKELKNNLIKIILMKKGYLLESSNPHSYY